MNKFAIILEIGQLTLTDPLGLGTNKPFIVNYHRPYRVSSGAEKEARAALQKQNPHAKIIIADKQTLLDNPFDLQKEDFVNPMEIKFE